QLPRQCHDPDLPKPCVARTEALLVPQAQGTLGLPAEPAPGDLHHHPTHPAVTRLADALLALTVATGVRGRGQPGEARQLAAGLCPAPAQNRKSTRLDSPPRPAPSPPAPLH